MYHFVHTLLITLMIFTSYEYVLMSFAQDVAHVLPHTQICCERRRSGTCVNGRCQHAIDKLIARESSKRM